MVSIGSQLGLISDSKVPNDLGSLWVKVRTMPSGINFFRANSWAWHSGYLATISSLNPHGKVDIMTSSKQVIFFFWWITDTFFRSMILVLMAKILWLSGYHALASDQLANDWVILEDLMIIRNLRKINSHRLLHLELQPTLSLQTSHYKQPNRQLENISLRPNGKRLYRPDTLA